MSRVLVLLAQGCEELEAVTITDLLVRAGMDVTTAGLDEQPVTASRGLRLLPDTNLDAVSAELFDMIVLPGGLPGAHHLRDDARVQELIRRHHKDGRLLGAICAAPAALAAAGVLDGKTATAYPGTLEAVANPAIKVSDSVLEIDGNVVTSRGPGTAMDFALCLIERLAGPETRDQVEKPLLRPAAAQ